MCVAAFLLMVEPEEPHAVCGQSRAVGESGSKAPLQTLLNQGGMCRCHRLSARLPKEEVTFSVPVSLLFLDQLGVSSLATKW